MFGFEREEKKVYNPFDLYDTSKTEALLEKQAENGWLLYEYTGEYWKFRKSEPQKLQYSVAFISDPSGDKVEEFRQYCAKGGWQSVTGCGHTHIFCSELDNPVPIETDPVLALETIHKLVTKRRRKTWLIMDFLALLYFGIFALQLSNQFLNTLLNHRYVCVTIAICGFLLTQLIEFVLHELWYRKAHIAAERYGEFARRKSYNIVLDAIVIILVAFASYGEYGPYNLLGYFEKVNFSLYVIFGIRAVERISKYNVKLSRGMERAISVIVFLALIISNIVLSELAEDWQKRHAVTPPVVAADICEDDSGILEDWNVKESILLGRCDWQAYRHTTEEDLSIRYTITKVQFPALYDLCFRDLTSNIADWNTYSQVQIQPWMAQQVFYKTDAAGETYFLCYEEHFVELHICCELTEDQIAVIAEKLKKQ